MKLTTLCYIEKDGKYLMLHRVKKEHDINKGKYIGVGGHFEHGESPDDCLKREVFEETGLKLKSYRARGIVTFIYGEDTVEYMHLYTADKPRGKIGICDEGDLVWVKKEKVPELELWEGDRIFLDLLNKDIPFFSLKLVYSLSDELISAVLNGEEILKNFLKKKEKIKTVPGATEKKEKTVRKVKEEALKDKDIREPLFSFLEDSYGKVRVLEEKTVGKSRADVLMVVPDGLYGIEIKSDADTYARLSRQVKDYDRYFDYNIVVVGSSHGEHTHEHVPPYWGIITVEIVDGKFDFYVLRKPQPNPNMEWKRKLELLWRPELARLQEWNRMPKYKGLAKAKVAEKIIDLIPELISEDLLKKQISEILFERDYVNAENMLKEYRRSEIDKQIDLESDPLMREMLLKKKENAVKNAVKNLPTPRKRYRRRRRRL